ncbi:MAG TPA: HAMP domain-containing sensor histidine kinase [Vicinamibacterales bacterium]|nr:HAMP domain-containing sensor histidine kinase [Vicinamibacterales bacterium]
MTNRASEDFRILVFAPIGRDAALTTALLDRASIRSCACDTLPAMCEEIERGAGALILTEEAVVSADFDLLTRTLEEQPAWSDVPVLMFAGTHGEDTALRTQRTLELLRNVTILDRPVRVAAAISMIRAALRSRQRQYELRDVLVALQKARSEAENANRLKDEFLATLSHELRTPLNAILGWTSMLREAQIEPERVPAVLQIIDRNARVQTKLIGDVLDVSRMITGRFTLHLAPVDLSVVVTDAVNAVRPAAIAKAIELACIDDHAPAVLGDAERLQQVCWNLLTNAIKFTPAGGHVQIATRSVDHGVEVTVTDDGVGLSAQFLPYVFDRFRQADQSFSRTHGGLGLGLAIVKHLVEMHGGRVSAESRGMGLGATFRVQLPPVSMTAAAPESFEAQAAVGGRSDG